MCSPISPPRTTCGAPPRPAERHPDRAAALGVTNEEIAAWRDAADAVTVPYDSRLRVHQQSAGFTRLPE